MSDLLSSIGSVKKSKTERISIEVVEYKGKRALDIRTKYKESAESVVWLPGKGAWIPANLVTEVLDLLTTGRGEIIAALNRPVA